MLRDDSSLRLLFIELVKEEKETLVHEEPHLVTEETVPAALALSLSLLALLAEAKLDACLYEADDDGCKHEEVNIADHDHAHKGAVEPLLRVDHPFLN